MGKVCSPHHNTTLITADREVGLFLIHFSKNMMVVSKYISWYSALISSAVFPAFCFQLRLCYWYNTISTAPPRWRPQVFLLCILLLVAAFQGKDGSVSKGLAIKICSLVGPGKRSWWRWFVAQKTMVLYIMVFDKVVKKLSTDCTVLESGSLATLKGLVSYDHYSWGKLSSKESCFQFGFVVLHFGRRELINLHKSIGKVDIKIILIFSFLDYGSVLGRKC